MAKEKGVITLHSMGNSVKHTDGRHKKAGNLDFEKISELMLLCDPVKSTYRGIAKEFGVTLDVLDGFLRLDAYKARTAELNALKAEAWIEKGWEILNGEKSENNWEENRVKNKAEWCMKMAAANNKTKYGNRLEVTTIDQLATPEARAAKKRELEMLMLISGDGDAS